MIKLKRKVFNALADNALFRRDLKMVAYRLDGVEGIRNIIGMQGFKQVLLIFCDNKKNISEFIEKIKIILYSLCFDEDIVESMRHLNDGFENRKKEIIYHLYCIDNEILKIMKQIPQGYREIGDRMSIDCSPERSRDIVRSSLTKEINGIDVNCELHTKMKRLTSNAPDRVYFCPQLPMEIGENGGQTYIYKITKHA
ncbi:MAG TPA: hypothetical protein GX707_08195 [Epulopiscium sp.]|nr:hypothetical protein [Candidatus Epulonipiscium sp.]